MVSGNNIYCELPIKYILWTFVGSYGKVSTDTVAAFAADCSENLTLSNNYIHTLVNYRSFNYPTLDTVILYGCSHSMIENNVIRSEDFITKVGQDNYLYALDLYNLNNVTVIKIIFQYLLTEVRLARAQLIQFKLMGLLIMLRLLLTI